MLITCVQNYYQQAPCVILQLYKQENNVPILLLLFNFNFENLLIFKIKSLMLYKTYEPIVRASTQTVIRVNLDPGNYVCYFLPYNSHSSLRCSFLTFYNCTPVFISLLKDSKFF